MARQRGTRIPSVDIWKGTIPRVVNAIWGGALALLGLLAMWWDTPYSLLSLSAGAALVWWGWDHLQAAYRGTEPWLARIGPLP